MQYLFIVFKLNNALGILYHKHAYMHHFICFLCINYKFKNQPNTCHAVQDIFLLIALI